MIRLSAIFKQWDLNTGQIVRKFTAHGAQLVGIAVKPISSGYLGENTFRVSQAAEDSGAVHFRADTMQVQSSSGVVPGESGTATTINNSTNTMASDNSGQTQMEGVIGPGVSNSQQAQDSDTKSEMSYDPLFDDEPDADGGLDNEQSAQAQ